MRLLISSGIFLFLLWLSLAVWSNQAVPVPVVGMLGIQFVAWAVVIGLWVRYRDCEKEISNIAIISLALFMRLPSFYATPIYEDDYFRFLWDGWNFVTTGTPYNGPPANYFDEPGYSDSLQGILYSVNYPEVATIYAPVCQSFFALGAFIEPLKLWSLRLVLLMVEMSMLLLFSRLVTSRQLLLFAWCPLLVFENLFQVHPDFLAASFLLLAYVARKHNKHLSAGICCALALGIKVTVLPALAFLLWPLRKHGLIAFAVTCIAMYLPFFLQGSRADFDGLLVFAREWEFNASLYSIGASYFPSTTVKFIMLGIFTSTFLYFWFSWQRQGSNQGEIPITLVVIYGVLFLVSPVVNSWYLLLILPFVCLAPQPWSVSALIVVSLSYIRGQTLPDSPLDDFQQPIELLVIEYASILILVIFPTTLQKFTKKNELASE